MKKILNILLFLFTSMLFASVLMLFWAFFSTTGVIVGLVFALLVILSIGD